MNDRVMQLPAMLELLERLVNIDSGSMNVAGVNKVSGILTAAYQEIGFVPTVCFHPAYGNTVILRHKEAHYPGLLLTVHTDTVFPDGTAKKRPFVSRGDYAYGPGVFDMKASQVMLLSAMKSLALENSQTLREIEIIINPDEEIGSISSREIIELRSSGKKAALITEPGGAEGQHFFHSRMGGGRYKIRVSGRAAHAGMEPQKGINAIQDLAMKITRLHALTDYDQGIFVNVGLIKGGTAANTIPQEAEGVIDVRISTAEQEKWVEEAMKTICAHADVQGSRTVLVKEMERPPLEPTAASFRLVSLIESEAHKLNIDLKAVADGGRSDGNLIAARGVPTVDGLGPAGGNPHSDKEFLFIPSLVPRTHLLINVLKKLCLLDS